MSIYHAKHTMNLETNTCGFLWVFFYIWIVFEGPKKVGSHQTGITLPHFYDCPNPGPGVPMPLMSWSFSVQLFEVVIS